ncbi:hypothetical protein ANN_13389 [Periplaneta americana]|uniref:Uncharacterized protein n=1 Tax=Periplaneta americana TaxID=6978 RepID=A0ABQ8TL30_PERAM|nr:hypothetical protein ANN_13389 [Periplaneta americana]
MKAMSNYPKPFSGLTKQLDRLNLNWEEFNAASELKFGNSVRNEFSSRVVKACPRSGQCAAVRVFASGSFRVYVSVRVSVVKRMGKDVDDDDDEGRRGSTVPARSLLLSNSTKGAARHIGAQSSDKKLCNATCPSPEVEILHENVDIEKDGAYGVDRQNRK